MTRNRFSQVEPEGQYALLAWYLLRKAGIPSSSISVMSNIVGLDVLDFGSVLLMPAFPSIKWPAPFENMKKLIAFGLIAEKDVVALLATPAGLSVWTAVNRVVRLDPASRPRI